ncbi:fungal-specific transcription factor domain-containing protein [Penicillium herquei]|nr:fungal-specific transcription factor domain-containing protein [Penicillium herquei]
MRPCNYQVGTDKRKISLKLVVDLLVARIDKLYQFISENDIAPPPMFGADEVALKDTLKNLQLHEIQRALEDIPTRDRRPSSSSQPDPASNTFPRDAMGLEYTEIENLDSVTNMLTNPFLLVEGEDSPSDGPSSAPIAPGELLMQDKIEGTAISHDLIDYTSIPENQGVIPANLPVEVNDSPGHVQDVSPEIPAQTNMNEKPSDISKSEPQHNDSLEDIVHKLSDRMGSLQIGSDGQFRYYGPTSHFNLLRMPTPDNMTIHRTVRKDGKDYLIRMGIDQEVPRDMEEHLTNLFFTWHGPSVDVVDRNIYEVAKQQWQEHIEDTPYYSEALTSAMCCLGAAFEARYHPTFITYPKSLSDFFADRAKTLLEIELDSPTVATVQAMVVLSGHDIGCRRDARGWLYSGMAMRLAFDLGLHLDMTPYVANGSISQAEAELRSMVFWGAYTLDHHWGYLLGRPFRTNLEDVTVQKPGLYAKRIEAQRWCPYGLPYATSFPAGLSIPLFAPLLSLHRVTLSEIMTPLGHVLYGSSQTSKEELQRLNVEVTDKLLHWKENLPTPLKFTIDDYTIPPLPHVLLLHMHYHQAIIHAHRPWMSKSSIQPQPQQGPGHAHARMMCIESATYIAQLLRIYEKYYTFQRINVQAVAITCSAALMLIFAKAINHSVQDDKATLSNLNICFRALEEFGSSWESAKRAQGFLLHMQRLWDTRVRLYNSIKRLGSQSEDISHPETPASKRSRNSFTRLVGGHNDHIYGNTSVHTESSCDGLDLLWAATMGTMPRSAQ